VYKLVTN